MREFDFLTVLDRNGAVFFQTVRENVHHVHTALITNDNMETARMHGNTQCFLVVVALVAHFLSEMLVSILPDADGFVGTAGGEDVLLDAIIHTSNRLGMERSDQVLVLVVLRRSLQVDGHLDQLV